MFRRAKIVERIGDRMMYARCAGFLHMAAIVQQHFRFSQLLKMTYGTLVFWKINKLYLILCFELQTNGMYWLYRTIITYKMYKFVPVEITSINFIIEQTFSTNKAPSIAHLVIINYYLIIN